MYVFMTPYVTQGLNFQLAAVILSVGVYAYIENSELSLHHQQYISLAILGLRTKLSQRLDACIMDRPCALGCNHRYTVGVSDHTIIYYK